MKLRTGHALLGMLLTTLCAGNAGAAPGDEIAAAPPVIPAARFGLTD